MGARPAGCGAGKSATVGSSPVQVRNFAVTVSLLRLVAMHIALSAAAVGIPVLFFGPIHAAEPDKSSIRASEGHSNKQQDGRSSEPSPPWPVAGNMGSGHAHVEARVEGNLQTDRQRVSGNFQQALLNMGTRVTVKPSLRADRAHDSSRGGVDASPPLPAQRSGSFLALRRK